MSEKKTGLKIFLGVVTGALALVTVWSVVAGTTIVSEQLPERAIEQEAFKTPHATFELDEGEVCELYVDAVTLSNSWMWVKTLILDDKGRPVLEYKFDLSYYHGSGWSEGDSSDSRVFYLPKGKYKLLVYGEDAERRTGWTRPGHQQLQVTVSKDVVLTRYSLIGLILFGLGFGFTTMGGSGQSGFGNDDSFGMS